MAITDTVSAVSRTLNTSPARIRQLEASLPDIETAVDEGSAHDAQAALKRALEAIHELADCLKRSEWTHDGWSADELGLWHAHLGARNAAHHEDWSMIALHTDGTPDTRLRWDLQPGDMQELRSKKQAAEYNSRLAFKPVLPPLRQLLGLLSSAVT